MLVPKKKKDVFILGNSKFKVDEPHREHFFFFVMTKVARVYNIDLTDAKLSPI